MIEKTIHVKYVHLSIDLFIKMINKHNYQLIERKSYILTLIFIDICDSFSFLHFDHEYFLKIVNNHF